MGTKEIKTHVFVWGLNDKDQLGGPKGSKIKTPSMNETLSALNCIQITGGSKSLFCGKYKMYLFYIKIYISKYCSSYIFI